MKQGRSILLEATENLYHIIKNKHSEFDNSEDIEFDELNVPDNDMLTRSTRTSKENEKFREKHEKEYQKMEDYISNLSNEQNTTVTVFENCLKDVEKRVDDIMARIEKGRRLTSGITGTFRRAIGLTKKSNYDENFEQLQEIKKQIEEIKAM